MMVIHYDSNYLAPTCVPLTGIPHFDDVSEFKFTGPNWQVWFVPGTINPND